MDRAVTPSRRLHKGVFDSTPSGEIYKDLFDKILAELKSIYQIEYIYDNNILKISKDKKAFTYLTPYDLGINDSLTYTICKDKKLCEYLLKRNSISIVPHELFISYKLKNFYKKAQHNNTSSDSGKNSSNSTNANNKENFYEKFISKFNEYNGKIVLKPNKSQSGKDVYLISSLAEANSIFIEMLDKYNGVVLNPFRDVVCEYRIFILNKQYENSNSNIDEIFNNNYKTLNKECIILALKKTALKATGDGHLRLTELIANLTFRKGVKKNEILNDINSFFQEEELNKILAKGEEKILHWKLNQCFGSTVEKIPQQQLNKDLTDLALAAANALKLDFGCIDIFLTKENKYEVIEANTRIITDLYDNLSFEELTFFFKSVMQIKFNKDQQKRKNLSKFFSKKLNNSVIFDKQTNKSYENPSSATASTSSRNNSFISNSNFNSTDEKNENNRNLSRQESLNSINNDSNFQNKKEIDTVTSYRARTFNIKQILNKICIAKNYNFQPSPEMFDYLLTITANADSNCNNNFNLTNKLTCNSFSFKDKNWNETLHFINWDLGLNLGSSALIAAHKAFTYEVLKHHNIPCIPHVNLNLNKLDSDWNSEIADIIHQLGLKEGDKLVIKDSKGSNGQNCFVCCVNNLEEIFQKIFLIHKPDISFCKFYEIEKEIRLLILNDQVLLAFEKQKPFVIGDGKAKLFELLFEYIKSNPKNLAYLPTYMEQYTDKELKKVIEKNEKIFLNWRHNLKQGAKPVLLYDLSDDIKGLGLDAAAAAAQIYCAVDIIQIEGKSYVLEINNNPAFDCFLTFYTEQVEDFLCDIIQSCLDC